MFEQFYKKPFSEIVQSDICSAEETDRDEDIGKDCLLVTHGHNTYKNPEGNPREKLETLLEELTRQYPFRKLFVPLFQALQPSLYPSSGKTYCFIVGVKEYPSSSIYRSKFLSSEKPFLKKNPEECSSGLYFILLIIPVIMIVIM